MDIMERRKFIKWMFKGALSTSGICALPTLWFSENGFDLAMKGQMLIQQQKFSEAAEILEKAVKLDPKSDWSYGLLGRAYRGAGLKGKSVSAFRKAVRINPHDTYSRMMIEILTQKPITRVPQKKTPLTPLEIEAQREEAAVLEKIQAEKGLEYSVRRVVIDAGHGGFDSGAVGASGLMEKDVTLGIALKLHDKILSQGKVQSFLTRTGDYYVPLSARAIAANQYQADLFISIHINANKKRTPHGSETYFCSEKASSKEAQKVAAFENSVLKFDKMIQKEKNFLDFEGILRGIEQKIYWRESEKFARSFQDRIRDRIPMKSRGINSANFYVLRKAKMPSILLELGFISNAADETKLKQPGFIEKIVDAISRGLV